MSGDINIWIVVPAAGVGSRMGEKVPKQYLSLRGLTVLEQTLKVLLQVSDIKKTVKKIIVALHPDDQHWPNLPLNKERCIETVVGGNARFHSVLNALEHIGNQAGLNDWVLVHDAARPCITVERVQYLIDQLVEHPVGGLLAVPVSDTLKAVTKENEIISTVDRQGLWQAQTPQMFRYGLLKEALQSALGSGQEVTDEASAIELCGHQVLVVQGKRNNIKVTHPEDLLMAELILQAETP